MSTKKILCGLSLYILIFSTIFLVVKGISNNIVFTVKHYTAIGTVFVATILFFTKYHWSVYFISIILFLGAFNIFHYTYTVDTYSFSFSIGKFMSIKTFDLQIFSLILLIVHFLLNKKQILGIFKESSQTKEDIINDERETMIKYYEKKFSTKSKKELELMIKNKNSLSCEAIEASRRVLEKLNSI